MVPNKLLFLLISSVLSLMITACVSAPGEFTPIATPIPISDSRAGRPLITAENVTDLAEVSLITHRLGITDAAFTPDGSAIATGSPAGIQVWGSQSGGALPFDQLLFERQPGFINDVEFSPDGRLLAAAGSSSGDFLRPMEVWLWAIDTGELVHHLEHRIPSGSLSFSPDATILATGGRQAHFWNLETGEEVDTFGSFTSAEIGFSPNGRFIANITAWSSEEDVGEILELRSSAILTVAPKDGSSSKDVIAFAPNGDLVAFGGWRGTQNRQSGIVWLWDGSQTTEYSFNAPIISLAFSSTSALLAVGDTLGRLHLLDLESEGVPISSFQGSGTPYGLYFSPDGTLIATVYRSGSLSLWGIPPE